MGFQIPANGAHGMKSLHGPPRMANYIVSIRQCQLIRAQGRMNESNELKPKAATNSACRAVAVVSELMGFQDPSRWGPRPIRKMQSPPPIDQS